MAAYGVDVLDRRVSPRRVQVLFDNLPPAYRRVGEEWSTEAELLALLVDGVAELTYVTAKAAGGRAKRPKPIPRPKRRGPAGESAAPRSRRDDGPVKHRTWADAIASLAGMPGVSVTRG